MNDGQESEGSLSLDEKIELGLERIKEIPFFEYVEPINGDWLRQQASILLDTLNLPDVPLQIITSIDEGNKFAEQVDKNNEWVQAWEEIRFEALQASGGHKSTQMKIPWYYSRRESLDITEKLEQEGGRMEREAGKRCASWVQYITVEDKLKKPNPLTPFIAVNEKGADLIGVANGVFGAFVPQPKTL